MLGFLFSSLWVGPCSLFPHFFLSSAVPDDLPGPVDLG